MKKILLSIIGMMAMSGAMAQSRISVHDPSIVMDVTGSTTNPKYYIYGSHLGRGKTYASGNYRYGTPSRRVKRIPVPATVFLLT